MQTEAQTHGRVMIVDDEADTATLIAEILGRRGFVTEAVDSGNACLEAVDHFAPDVVVTDVMMEGMSGLELCEKLRVGYPEVLPIVVTGRSGFDSAISAMRAGAYDYIVKPVAVPALEVAIVRAMLHLELQRELANLRVAVQNESPHGVIGECESIKKTLALAHRIAASDATVLITGESGTGKELVARTIHHESSRSNEPFIAINCAAMPAPLLESELFGHVRGAFTDATRSRPGLFVQAGRGTIFLDEIGEMPMEMQVKLLRVLQERMVRAVGSDTETHVEARVIAATNRDLERAVADKHFREDLYYRINVVPIEVPSLRQRGSDVLLLAHYFMRKIAARIRKPVVAITAAAAKLILAYHWPGNVRELENCMERAVAICQLDQITIEDLPQKLRARPAPAAACEVPNDLMTLAEMRRRYVQKAMIMTGGNKTRAAQLLGIDRRSLYRRLEETQVF